MYVPKQSTQSMRVDYRSLWPPRPAGSTAEFNKIALFGRTEAVKKLIASISAIDYLH